ncbi:sugar ABC transporter substrate-binding protein [Streptomyces sp. H10-C2]|uniref:sugar ABC transporter substrate-binding protein n=1 Tax=unclassified Streptomyces TaxID=2593676 RepID=UPI0024BBEA9E|nr:MULTISPECIES: sugar ABC transporter substrate-binding protein [unclassified Streptomyces]MDJ0347339.1 sugar ABC transporter substrate-binding protein [Streptomyces sp. PH10-H1]MDJ0375458.1 sugar ABC transporter substrate-binding protein [Streptomyces sp. H10-C2]
MNRKPVVLSATAALLLATALTGCGQEGDGAKSDGASKGGKPTVCLVMKSLGNEYFQTMQKGAEDHARQRGDLTLTASGIQNETDIDGQVAAINRCITDKAAALVLAPADSQALVAPLKRAVKAGIKVVNIDVKLDDAALKAAGLDVPFVGPDNTEGARLSGAVLAKALGKDGRVVILEGNPGAANAQQRKAGFVAAAAAGGLRVLDSKTAHWETDEAYTVVSNMLTAHPDIQGVLASNDSMALGAVKAVAAEGRKSQVKVASFDNIEAIRPYVKDGSVVATVDQFAAKQAGDGIDQAMKLIAGDKVQGWVKTDVKVITASDLG